MTAPTAPRQNFITRDHRYVYLGGSLIALLGLGMFYSAPSPYSFIPAQSVFGTALAVICWFFLRAPWRCSSSGPTGTAMRAPS